ncbi:Transposon TX1 uncharacterized 149 kDa protein [Linum perenne]
MKENLIQCSKKLLRWKKKTFGGNRQSIETLKKELDALTCGAYTTCILEEIDKKQKELVSLWKEEEEFWARRTGVQWAKFRDKNTRFFHLSTIQRRGRNHIAKLKNESGTWLEEDKEIRTHVTSFFHSLFEAPKEAYDLSIVNQMPKLITGDMDRGLSRDVEEWEIKKAVFQMGPNKSPGPDGFAGSFYQRHWDLVKDDLVKEVKEFFMTGVYPEDWNLTHIALIPKVHHPKLVSQYRPISVANFKAKVISKIISTRLKPILPGLVSELLAAFTGNRCIQDSVILVHEVIHRLKHRRKGKNCDFIMKVDMMKAYDRVSWDFLFAVLDMMCFGSRWIGWIRATVCSVKFAVMINGTATGFFSPTRGLRQGDPLSPFLFIMITNALTYLIHSEVAGRNLKGIRLTPRCPVLTHVLFADDTVISGKADKKEASKIKEILARYSALSGQKVNEEKSAIFFSKYTPEELGDEVANELGVSREAKFGKYLGLPAEWGNSKMDTFYFLIDRMINKAGNWKSLLLSQGGKETLAKAVLQAVPSYVFSCFMLPDSLLKKMDAVVAKFWWSGDVNRRGIHWCSKDRLTTAKHRGGLGFRSFKEFNLAHLAKLCWRIIQQPDALWVRVLKDLYFPRTDFMNAKRHHRPSWIWGSIVKGRAALIKGLRKNIGNGEETSVNEAWIPSAVDFRCNPMGDEECKIADCIIQNTRQWNLAKLRTMFTESVV